MDPHDASDEQVGPEHFLALFYGVSALVLGAVVWSAIAADFGLWSLPAAPALGWLVAWATRYGGRRTDTFVRALAWVMAFAAGMLALFAYVAFSVTQTSPDSGFDLRAVASEYLRLFGEPPWFGPAAVLLSLVGTWRALRDPPARRAAARPGRGWRPSLERGRAPASGTAADDPGSRAA